MSVQFVIGACFYKAGWETLRTGTDDMDLLVMLGASAAYGLSLWLWWRVGADGTHHALHLYFGSATMVITLVRPGKWLEVCAKRQTVQVIRALQTLYPDIARMCDADGALRDTPAAQVRVGDAVSVRIGERIPVDAVVLEDASHIDESVLIGGSLPMLRRDGDRATAGTVATDGVLLVHTVTIDVDTTLSRIIRLVEGTQAAKPPTQQLVDRVSAISMPAVPVAVLLVLTGWFIVGTEWKTVVVNAVAVLVIACPCALGLAAPSVIMAGTGAGAQRGILITDAQALERARQADLIVFGKTGTLTVGRPHVTSVEPASGIDADMLLNQLVVPQAEDTHLLTQTTRDYVKGRGRATMPTQSPEALTGRGIRDIVNGASLQFGNARWVDELGPDCSAL